MLKKGGVRNQYRSFPISSAAVAREKEVYDYFTKRKQRAQLDTCTDEPIVTRGQPHFLCRSNRKASQRV
jgi:hypothetical protein